MSKDLKTGKKRTWEDVAIDFFGPLWEKYKVPMLIFSLTVFFLIALFFNRIFINIYPGYAGVLWKRFDDGTQLDVVYKEGLHFINPFNKMYIYETRVQQRDCDFTVLSKNGLVISIRSSVRFMPQIDNLPLLNQEVGPEYVDRVVLPQVQSVVRKIIGAYLPDEIYGTQGSILQNIALDALGELKERYIILDDLLIKELKLPDNVAQSIERKLQEEQRFLEYQYRIAAEEQEIRRKKLEADGIKIFQETIVQSLTPAYLKYQGIQATLELAKSQNSKIIMIGNDDKSLPLILNADSSTAANK